MIKINGFEHVSWAAPELEPGQRTLALFGIKPTGFEEIHDQDVTANYFEGDGGVRFEIIRPLGPKSHLRRFLGTRGPGLHHVCFQIDSLGTRRLI
jgi:methylmalonyl-CoA/ethylmalonyl-CoA epimerase